MKICHGLSPDPNKEYEALEIANASPQSVPDRGDRDQSKSAYRRRRWIYRKNVGLYGIKMLEMKDGEEYHSLGKCWRGLGKGEDPIRLWNATRVDLEICNFDGLTLPLYSLMVALPRVD